MIVAFGLALLIFALNDLTVFNRVIHINVNISVPILVLLIGYLPFIYRLRKKKRSWKEITSRQIDLLEIVLLAFFVIMDSIALMALFPDNYRQQNIIFYSGLLLVLILAIKMVRYQHKEPKDTDETKNT